MRASEKSMQSLAISIIVFCFVFLVVTVLYHSCQRITMGEGPTKAGSRNLQEMKTSYGGGSQ
jgi:hypothetical protein